MDNGFIKECQHKDQRLTYCGINAHFQNGSTEKQIRDLQEATRTSMLFAAHQNIMQPKCRRPSSNQEKLLLPPTVITSTTGGCPT